MPKPSPHGEGEAPAFPAVTSAVEPDQDAQLAAFLQRHGPNRRHDLIYDWYNQCLGHAGIEPERVWYLSSEELTYLTKGKTDQVRLSVLISTTDNLNVPPRRITCYGTAEGRELTLHRTE